MSGNNDKPVFTGISSYDLNMMEEAQLDCFTDELAKNIKFCKFSGNKTASVEHFLNDCTARLYRTFSD